MSGTEPPKTWKDSSHRKRHLVGLTMDGGVQIVVSRHWLAGRKRWHYEAETREDVDFQIKLTSRKI
ncbi:hypothetical protein ACNFCI_09820 [Pseudomonas sp. NY15356]|uniref:hypothetical protein n=1 Tax=Pseudomonas sp. NY15356 TaxID=3400352 RepID=UPI003A8ACB58